MRRKTKDDEAVEADGAPEALRAEVGGDRDDRSSSLSEPEDEHDGSEEHDEVDGETLDGEHGTAQRSLEVDSEAETERLDQTPQKQRKHPDNLGRTPSKLSQAATADEDLSEPPSPVPAGAGAASSTSTIATTGQKRKRSDTVDSSLSSVESESGESPRKRKHEATEDVPMDENEVQEVSEQNEEVVEPADETPILEEPRKVPAKGPRGRKGKQKGRKAKELVSEAEQVQAEEVAETVEEPSEEDPVKTEEQRKFRKEASSLYSDVTKQFRAFKERLYNERLKTLDAELQLLSQPECAHPEYMQQVAAVDARLEKQRREANAYYNYKLRSIRQRTLGERSQLHSQYFQRVRQLREDVLDKIGEEWYGIQRERRQSHQDKDDTFLYKFQTKRSLQLRQQAKYNQEVSVLSGIAKFVGFPAAPGIEGADAEGFEEDLRAMKISRRAAQPTASQTRPVYLPGPTAPGFTQDERLAHEQYLEQNPWARPQASIQMHGALGISHTPDWAEQPAVGGGPGSSSKFIRNPAGQNPRHSSPFTTPVPQQKQAGMPSVGMQHSDTFADHEAPLPSSVIATTGGTRHPQQGDGGFSSDHQPSPVTFQKPRERENGRATTLPQDFSSNFRNISNISGVSTIDADAEEPQPQPSQDSATKRVDMTEDARPILRPPGFVTEHSGVEQSVFDTSQIHRHPEEDGGREVYATPGFMRPREGAFGTPTPLQAAASGTGAGSGVGGRL